MVGGGGTGRGAIGRRIDHNPHHTHTLTLHTLTHKHTDVRRTGRENVNKGEKSEENRGGGGETKERHYHDLGFLSARPARPACTGPVGVATWRRWDGGTHKETRRPLDSQSPPRDEGWQLRRFALLADPDGCGQGWCRETAGEWPGRSPYHAHAMHGGSSSSSSSAAAAAAVLGIVLPILLDGRGKMQLRGVTESEKAYMCSVWVCMRTQIRCSSTTTPALLTCPVRREIVWVAAAARTTMQEGID